MSTQSPTLRRIPAPQRDHYDSDRMSRINTIWTRTTETCPDCGSLILRGTRLDGRPDRLACSGCVAVFVEGPPDQDPSA